MNEIILKAEGELVDKDARELISMMDTRITTLNDRTKRQTIQIGELNKRIKELEK